LALENNEFVLIKGEKIPYITVTVDGSWSKRSYGHGYNSNGGMAVIIGQRTKKVLWVDTRIKTCQQCTRNAQMNSEKEHDCQKNWTRSSQSMEADIIVQGFQKSLEVHGLIYKYVVGDGDSSVYSNILTRVKYPGVQVAKYECVNHAVKCMNKAILEIQKDTRFQKKDRDCLKARHNRFGKGAMSAIRYNNSNQLEEPPTNYRSLAEDMRNLPFHIFGNHTKCKDYFCVRKESGEKDLTKELNGKQIWVDIQNACHNIGNKASMAKECMSHRSTGTT
jgi:hypothetical protein